eukprot:5179619-Lingulodinium_polyedra.AAC.1
MVVACDAQFVCGGGPIYKSMRRIQHRGVTAPGQHDFARVVIWCACCRFGSPLQTQRGFAVDISPPRFGMIGFV